MPPTSISNHPLDATFDPVRTSVSRRYTGDTNSGGAEVEQINLFQALSQVTARCSNLEELLSDGSDVICGQSECLGLWFMRKSDKQTYAQPVSLLTAPGAMPWQTVRSEGQKMIRLADVSRQVQSSSLSTHAEYQLIVAPVIFGSGVDTVIAGCFRDDPDVPLRNSWLLGILAQSATTWLSQDQMKRAESRSRSLNDVVSLTHGIDRADSIQSASVILVNQLKRLTQAQQVVFASVNHRGLPKLLAVSNVESVAGQFEGAKTMAQACMASIQARRLLVYPERRQPTKSAEGLALEDYCKSSGCDACISVPLITEDDQVIGALLLAVTTRQAQENSYTQYLVQVARMTAGHLQLMLRANRSVWQHAVAVTRNAVAGKSSRMVLALALLIVALMLLPMPYRVACNCEIQPVLRRFIAAPHDGVLQTNLVENGDVVKQHQPVAQLDGRQLRIELAGLEAELQVRQKNDRLRWPTVRLRKLKLR